MQIFIINRRITMHYINKYGMIGILMLGIGLSPGSAAHAQAAANDSSTAPHDSSSAPRESHMPIYHVNYWVSTPIILAGLAGGTVWLGIPKSNITDAELAAVNPNNVPSFDRISLHQNMAL